MARVRRDAKRYAFLPQLNSGELHVPANDVVGEAGVDLSLNNGGLLNRFRISLEALRDHFGLGEVTSQEETASMRISRKSVPPFRKSCVDRRPTGSSSTHRLLIVTLQKLVRQ